MPKTRPASVVNAEPVQEPLKIEFIWNGYLVVILRQAGHDYVMDIFPPDNDGSFRKAPVHTVNNITNLMTIRQILADLFEKKVI